MADLQDIQALMETIGEAVPKQAVKTSLLYVNKFEGSALKLPVNEISWVVSEEDFGIAPIVSSMQNSPVVGQGTYGQWKSSGIETRHVKAFTRDELENILTPDKKKRINAALHLSREAINSADRQYKLIEYVAHCVTARGSLTYLSNDASNRLKVSMTFPILTKTYSTIWTNAAADIITEVQEWLDHYALVGNGTPAAIRMTTEVWKLIRDNTVIKTYFANFRYSKNEAKGGVITKQMVQDALGWPPIEIYDERCPLQFTVKSNVSHVDATPVVIPLNEGTFGLNIGDEIMVRYNSTAGTYDEKCTITAVSDGVSVTAILVADLVAGDAIVAKPYYFPNNKILFVPNENSNNIQFVRMPFGIQAIGGNVKVLDRYGIYVDAFEGTMEKDLVVYRRFWDKFAWKCNPRAYLSCTVK